MNSKMRRVTTSGMLLLAALSFGCGADSQQSMLEMVPGPVSAVPQVGTGPLGTTRSAQRVAGSAGDVETANMAVDALFAILRGGALAAASPTGGAVADGSSMQLAALASSSDAPPVVSDAEQPHVRGMRSLKRLLVSGGAPTFTFDGDVCQVNAPDGTSLTLTGVSPLPVAVAGEGEPPQLGFTLSADVRARGTLGGEGGPNPVDLRIRGLTGTLRFVAEHDPIADLTIGDNGLSVSGSFDGIGGVATATGASGHFTNVEELNALLAGRDVVVRLSGVHVPGFFSAGQAQLTFSSIQVPSPGGNPSGRVFGSGDVSFDADLPFAQDGKVAHAAFEVTAPNALVFDAASEGPRSGTIVATVHYSTSSGSDQITITFENGEAQITGKLTNISGTAETVQTQGDATTARGSIAFVDGRAADHKIEVRRRTGGRRHIVFTVTIRTREGVQVLHMVGAVRGDKGLAGSWARSTFSGGTVATPPTTGQIQALEKDPEKAGSFRVAPDGQLELVNEAGNVLARGPMPSDWNKGL